ncbi:DNA (cytosine-5-)-methyltransferase [Ferrimonas sp. SCSIO 43195]|uniref:DNA (cytosine-5-)-methyltransferase n=1 Tax=Ferrimonas sp. SCSIO 43195 TaxID=2822844 RepID=UPI0020753255|nr:DNA (cytosine-5-)-methyltransferase [Ferrimonas sp. SCSIO 43195]USD38006.1 DNA (cytosine-5-)-methyltransferase [Ferrimonas sp. SCSIO 43195]
MSTPEQKAAACRDLDQQQKLLYSKRDTALVERLQESWDLIQISNFLNEVSCGDKWNRDILRKCIKEEFINRPLTAGEHKYLSEEIVPQKPAHYGSADFTFADLFAGIGGIRKGFEAIGGECIFSSEWNKFARKTYKANWYCDDEHVFNEDITDITLSNKEKHPYVSEEKVLENIRAHFPGELDVLLAGFPCQPFSLAGVSKKNSLGRAHGFECETQGTLFFDVEMIIKAMQPKAFVLENVKNLKSHDHGNTFRIIQETLDRLGYWVADVDAKGSQDPKIIDGKHFTPQHRERIVLVGFRKDLDVHEGFTLRDVYEHAPSKNEWPTFTSILEKDIDAKYQLTPRLWEYLFEYAKKHAAKGNGFGFGLVDPKNSSAVARTLSARYHKDGSEILVDYKGWDMSLAESDFWNEENQENRPRRLTPRECARLMGFDKPDGAEWKIPVSDTQAYRQFGNSVVVPVFAAVAKLMKPYIMEAIEADKKNAIKKEAERALA